MEYLSISTHVNTLITINIPTLVLKDFFGHLPQFAANALTVALVRVWQLQQRDVH